jgi:hypothetical protein
MRVNTQLYCARLYIVDRLYPLPASHRPPVVVYIVLKDVKQNKRTNQFWPLTRSNTLNPLGGSSEILFSFFHDSITPEAKYYWRACHWRPIIHFYGLVPQAYAARYVYTYLSLQAWLTTTDTSSSTFKTALDASCHQLLWVTPAAWSFLIVCVTPLPSHHDPCWGCIASMN